MGYDGWGSSRVPPPAKGASVERQAAEGAKAQRQDDRRFTSDPKVTVKVTDEQVDTVVEDLVGGTILGPIDPVPAGRTGRWLVMAHAYVVGPGSAADGALKVTIGHPFDWLGSTDETAGTVAAGAPDCWASCQAVTDLAPTDFQSDCSWVGDPIAEIHLIVHAVRLA